MLMFPSRKLCRSPICLYRLGANGMCHCRDEGRVYGKPQDCETLHEDLPLSASGQLGRDGLMGGMGTLNLLHDGYSSGFLHANFLHRLLLQGKIP